MVRCCWKSWGHLAWVTGELQTPKLQQKGGSPGDESEDFSKRGPSARLLEFSLDHGGSTSRTMLRNTLITRVHPRVRGAMSIPYVGWMCPCR